MKSAEGSSCTFDAADGQLLLRGNLTKWSALAVDFGLAKAPLARRVARRFQLNRRAEALVYLCEVKFLQKIPSLFGLATLTAFAACSSPNQPIAEHGPPSPASAAEMTLMARHDSLMAKEGQLFSLKTKIVAAHSPTAGPYLRGLAAADAAMMNWMHQYKAPDSTAAPAARLAYFRQQQQVLAGVSQRFRATMDSAALFISQHPASSARPASSK